MQRILMVAGAVAGLSAVAMASAAAHALDFLTPGRLQMVRSALQMHGWHSLAVLVCAVWWPRGGRLTVAAAGCFGLGIVVFCGEVYGAALGWWHVPAAAPVGGLMLMGGWVLLGLGAVRK